MRKAKRFELNEEDLTTLWAAIKSEKCVAVVKRATAFCLRVTGTTPDEVASLLSCNRCHYSPMA
jgi:hypothetical protein